MPKGWNCPKCGVLPKGMVKVGRNRKHYCKICNSEVLWESDELQAKDEANKEWVEAWKKSLKALEQQ